MAAKSTKGKKNTKSTAKKTQQKSGQSQNRDEIRGEIIILGLLAVCILLVLSNFGLLVQFCWMSVLPVKTGTIHHEATGHNEQKWVQDSAAWTETVTTGYKCSGCGATK